MAQEWKVTSNQCNPFYNHGYEQVKEELRVRGDLLQFIQNQTEELCKIAVQQDGLALRYVKEQTEEICLLAVQQNMAAIHTVEYRCSGPFTREEAGVAVTYKVITDQNNPLCGMTYDWVKEAIWKDWSIIEYVDDQTDKLCKIAVQRDWCALQYVKNQTEELCKLAVKQNGYALQFVKNQTPEICKLAVQQYGYALQYVGNQTEELCKIAVQQNGFALQYVRTQTEELCKLAVQQTGYALKWVKEQTPDICKLAVQQNGLALYYVKNQTEELCKLAVQQEGLALSFVKDRTEEICKLATRYTTYAACSNAGFKAMTIPRAPYNGILPPPSFFHPGQVHAQFSYGCNDLAFQYNGNVGYQEPGLVPPVYTSNSQKQGLFTDPEPTHATTKDKASPEQPDPIEKLNDGIKKLIEVIEKQQDTVNALVLAINSR